MLKSLRFGDTKNMSPDRVTFSSLGFTMDPVLLFSSEVDSSLSADLFPYNTQIINYLSLTIVQRAEEEGR
jgi:hypothetical protein